MTIVLSHSIMCQARPWQVFSIIATPENWPLLFEPCVAVDILERADGVERISVTAMVNGQPRRWQSRRTVDRATFKIDVEMTDPLTLVAAMRTRWRVYRVGEEQSLLVLEHDCDVVSHIEGLVAEVESVAAAEHWIKTAIDTNSTIELENIRKAAEASSQTLKKSDGLYQASHIVVCDASAETVFPFIADPERWPGLFKTCIAVSTLASDGGWNLVKIDAEQAGRIVSWTTRRRVNADALIVDYQLVDQMPYTQDMSGRWRVVPLGPNRCVLAVDRSWAIAEPVAQLRDDVTSIDEAANFVSRFVETNARREMEEIAAIAADHTAAPLFIETEIDVAVSADDMYHALANAGAWPSFAPHCRTLHVGFDDGIYQELRFEIVTATGEPEVFRSFRVCDGVNRRISFVQVEPPHALERHHGDWSIMETLQGARVTCRHFATPRRAVVARIAQSTSLAEQDAALRKMIGANSEALVAACAEHIQRRGKEQAA